MLVVWASVYKLFSPVEDLTFCVWLVVYEECYFSFKLGRKAFCHLEMARMVCSGPGGIKYACISQNMKLLLGMLWKGLKEVSRLLLLLYLGFISLGISVYRCSARPWIPVFTELLLLLWKHGPLLLWLHTGKMLWTAKCGPSEKQTHTQRTISMPTLTVGYHSHFYRLQWTPATEQLNPNLLCSPPVTGDARAQEESIRGRTAGLVGCRFRWLEENEEEVLRVGGWIDELEMWGREREVWKSDQWTELKKGWDPGIWQLQWRSKREWRITAGVRLSVC